MCVEKKFWRLGNLKNNQGLWYSMDGNFTGLIHSKFDFCKNKDLLMPFDCRLTGYLSVVCSYEELFVWFPKKDIKSLQCFGYRILEYTSDDYRHYNNHFIINQKTCKLNNIIKL